MFAREPQLAADTPIKSMEEIIPPSSVPSMVPSTGFRKSHRNVYPDSLSPCGEAIGTTPTKQTNFLRRPANEEPAIPPSSPLMQRTGMSGQQLFIPGSAVKEQRRIDFTSSRNEGIFATPIKRVAPQDAIMLADSPSAPPEKKTSIYQQLGWDDDLDDLL